MDVHPTKNVSIGIDTYPNHQKKSSVFQDSRLEQLMLTEALTELLDSTIWVSADSNRFHGMPPLIGGTGPDVGWWQISRIFQDVEMRHLELSGFGMFWRCHTGCLQFSSIFQTFHVSSIKSIKGWQNLHWLANHLIKTCCRRCWVSKKNVTCTCFFWL